MKHLTVLRARVNSRTYLISDSAGAAKVETTAYDLDAALDDAAQFFGEPLERIGPWLTDDGRNPEDEDVGNNTKVTCNVVRASEAHRKELP